MSIADENISYYKKELISKSAYFKWLDAGCPQNLDLQFWLEAEKEFIGPHEITEFKRLSSFRRLPLLSEIIEDFQRRKDNE